MNLLFKAYWFAKELKAGFSALELQKLNKLNCFPIRFNVFMFKNEIQKRYFLMFCILNNINLDKVFIIRLQK